MKKSTRENSRRLSARRWLQSGNVAGYIFISPWLFGFFALTLLPMLISLYFAFTNYNLISAPQWVGLQNFTRMLSDIKFKKSVTATLYYVLVSVPLKVGFALLVALLLNRKMKLTNFYRSMLYLPTLVGGGIPVALMWKQLFANEGVVNGLLGYLGIPPHSWLGDTKTAIWTIILLTVWQFGSSMLIFAAGLKQIPETYYEAAKIDGAVPWQMLLRITLPSLSPIVFFNLVMQVISAFMAFTQAFIVTQGGPLDSTLLYALYIYRKGFDYFDMGYACALSWVLIMVIAAVTLLVFRSSTAWVHYESEVE